MSVFEKGFLTEIKTTIMKGVYQDPEVKQRYMAYGLGGIRAPKVRSCFGIGRGLVGIGEPKTKGTTGPDGAWIATLIPTPKPVPRTPDNKY